jgi:hypothetical protein
MEVDMEEDLELTKKTTILLTRELHERLTSLAEQEGVSLGELVRRACESQYGIVSHDDRVKAVESLAALELPVADVHTMKKESTPEAGALLP